jgi:hypothetical protein
MIHVRISTRTGQHYVLCHAVVPEDACVQPYAVWHFRPEDAEHVGLCQTCLRKLRRPRVLRVPHELKPPSATTSA